MVEALEEILNQAKQCKLKGRLYVYETFKRQLEDLNLSSEDYTEACRELAKYLEV